MWTVATIPLVLLLFTLGVLRWKAQDATATGVFAAILVAFGMYRMDPAGIAIASAKGV